MRSILTMMVALVAMSSTDDVKPPKADYNKVRNETTWWTGEVAFRRGSSFRYWVAYKFKGKDPVAPKTVRLTFAAVRRIEKSESRTDAELAKWSDAEKIFLRWGEEPVELKAKYSRQILNDSFADTLGFRTFAEYLSAEIELGQIQEFAKSDEILVQLGDHTDTLRKAQLKPLRKLLEAINEIKADDGWSE